MTEKAPGRIRVQIDAELADLIPGYLENRRKDIGAITEALTKDDYDVIRILGHSMKGSGGGYGFWAITEMGHAIETAAKQGNAAAIRLSVGALGDYLDRIDIFYL